MCIERAVNYIGDDMKLRLKITAFAVAAACTGLAIAGEPEAKKWIDSEFQPSTLSKAQQMTENQFRFMHSDRVSHINETWQHFVQKNLKRI